MVVHFWAVMCDGKYILAGGGWWWVVVDIFWLVLGGGGWWWAVVGGGIASPNPINLCPHREFALGE